MPYLLDSAVSGQLKAQSRFNLINRFFLLNVILLTFSKLVLGSDHKPSPLPSPPPPPPQWKQCWQLTKIELTAVQPMSQNARLFLAAPGGKLFALNSETGEILWRTELGGEIVGQTPIDKSLIYVASRIAPDKDKPAAIIIRALSVETGLTVWQGELTQASKFILAQQGNSLLAASSTGDSNSPVKVIALSADKGQLQWTQILTAELSTSITVVNDSIIFATADQVMHVLKVIDGREIHRFTLPFVAREKIVFSKGLLIFGDQSGNVSALDETDGKILWTLRLGGAAQNILATENGVLISSLDDFVYFQNALSGKRIWRKRLPSRPLGAVLLTPEAMLVAATGENSVIILDLKKGNVLSQVLLGGENVAIAAPSANDNFAFIPTAQGILAFAPVASVCPAQ